MDLTSSEDIRTKTRMTDIRTKTRMTEDVLRDTLSPKTILHSNIVRFRECHRICLDLLSRRVTVTFK